MSAETSKKHKTHAPEEKTEGKKNGKTGGLKLKHKRTDSTESDSTNNNGTHSNGEEKETAEKNAPNNAEKKNTGGPKSLAESDLYYSNIEMKTPTTKLVSMDEVCDFDRYHWAKTLHSNTVAKWHLDVKQSESPYVDKVLTLYPSKPEQGKRAYPITVMTDPMFVCGAQLSGVGKLISQPDGSGTDGQRSFYVTTQAHKFDNEILGKFENLDEIHLEMAKAYHRALCHVLYLMYKNPTVAVKAKREQKDSVAHMLKTASKEKVNRELFQMFIKGANIYFNKKKSKSAQNADDPQADDADPPQNADDAGADDAEEENEGDVMTFIQKVFWPKKNTGANGSKQGFKSNVSNNNNANNGKYGLMTGPVNDKDGGDGKDYWSVILRMRDTHEYSPPNVFSGDGKLLFNEEDPEKKYVRRGDFVNVLHKIRPFSALTGGRNIYGIHLDLRRVVLVHKGKNIYANQGVSYDWAITRDELNRYMSGAENPSSDKIAGKKSTPPSRPASPAHREEQIENTQEMDFNDDIPSRANGVAEVTLTSEKDSLTHKKRPHDETDHAREGEKDSLTHKKRPHDETDHVMEGDEPKKDPSDKEKNRGNEDDTENYEITGRGKKGKVEK